MTDKDKLMHFGICLITGILSPMLALGLSFGKEYGDKRASGNHWCWWDIAADAAGIALAVILRHFLF